MNKLSIRRLLNCFICAGVASQSTSEKSVKFKEDHLNYQILVFSYPLKKRLAVKDLILDFFNK